MHIRFDIVVSCGFVGRAARRLSAPPRVTLIARPSFIVSQWDCWRTPTRERSERTTDGSRWFSGSVFSYAPEACTRSTRGASLSRKRPVGRLTRTCPSPPPRERSGCTSRCTTAFSWTGSARVRVSSPAPRPSSWDTNPSRPSRGTEGRPAPPRSLFTSSARVPSQPSCARSHPTWVTSRGGRRAGLTVSSSPASVEVQRSSPPRFGGRFATVSPRSSEPRDGSRARLVSSRRSSRKTARKRNRSPRERTPRRTPGVYSPPRTRPRR